MFFFSINITALLTLTFYLWRLMKPWIGDWDSRFSWILSFSLQHVQPSFTCRWFTYIHILKWMLRGGFNLFGKKWKSYPNANTSQQKTYLKPYLEFFIGSLLMFSWITFTWICPSIRTSPKAEQPWNSKSYHFQRPISAEKWNLY